MAGEASSSPSSSAPVKVVGPAGALPFPDLTGLRASAHDRVTKPSQVSSSQTLHFALSDLKKAADSLGTGEPEDVLALAWAIVLILLLAHEDDCHVAFTRQSDRHGDKAAISSINVDTTQRDKIDLQTLLHSLRQSCDDAESASTEDVQITLRTELRESGAAADGSQDGTPLADGELVKLSIANKAENGKLAASLHASSRVHTTESAQFLLEQFASCLSSIVKDAKASRLALDRHHFDAAQHAGDNPLPDPLQKDIGEGGLEKERFEDQMTRVAERQPDAIALDFRESAKARAGDVKAGNVQLTYKALLHMASVIGSELQRLVGGNGERGVVALCLEKTHWTYVSILGVLQAGMTWCPIDTDWPSARREALLGKCRAKVVLTAGDAVFDSLQEVLPEGMEVVRLDKLDMDAKPSSELSAWRKTASSSDLAYLIWTSGTTGLPKAVGIQHTAAVQALRALQDVIPHEGNDIRYLQFSAYNFDLMILDMFYTWGLGGTLCSSSRSVLLSNLVDIANAFQVSHTLLTPAVMAMTPRDSIPSLKVVINGGEKLSQVVADTWSVNCCLLNLYGPAEATLIAMNRRVPENDVVKAPNIGVALPTTSTHAVDPRNEIVIRGAVGELVIGGHQCAKGYIGDPDKTQDKFIEHKELGRIYKTGDLVRQLWNGDFEYLGRSDDQVKINGIRIELLEINAAIRNAHENVKDSETLVMPVEGGEEGSDVQIVNFSVLPPSDGNAGNTLLRKDDEALGIARHLIQQARSSLPTYMVPAVFVIVTHFPKTSSAKIDREALKKGLREFDVIDWQNRLANDENDESASDADAELEKAITEQVAQICRIDASRVGRRTPLPTLGLDSIRAITLARKLNAAKISVSVVDIVQCGTVAGIAAQVHQSSSSQSDRLGKSQDTLSSYEKGLRSSVSKYLQSKGEPYDLEKILPATPLQEGLITESIQDESRYWLNRVYALPADVDVKKLKAALTQLISRHEILRTIFATLSSLKQDADESVYSSRVAQIVVKDSRLECHDIDASATSGADEVAEEAGKKFSRSILEAKPPVAFAVASGPKPLLIIHIHHALYDAIALGYIESDIASLYAGHAEEDYKSFASGLPFILPLDNEEAGERAQIWEKLLKNYPRNQSVELPNLSGLERSATSSQIEAFSLESGISYADLCSAAIDMGTSARPLTQAALAGVLSRLCDTEHVMIGDSISGRAVSSELDKVVGPVLSTLAVPVAVSTEATYGELSKELSQFQQDALPVAHVSLSRIRRLLEVPSSSPLFHAVFVFEPPNDSEEDDEDAKTRQLLKREGDFGISVEHDLAFEITVTREGAVRLGLNVRQGLIPKTMALAVLSQYEHALQQAMNSPSEGPQDLHTKDWAPNTLSISSIESEKDMQKASQTFVLEAFERHAQEGSQSTAVEFAKFLDAKQRDIMSYSELEHASRALAVRIRDATPDKSVVAVTLDRSIDTYVALLAILRAGRCYLPIDVTLPADRKETLMDDSKAALLLCSNSTRWIKEDARVLLLDGKYDDSKAGEELPTPEPDDAAYILYTSGSTGKPKGCLLTHANLSAAIEAFRRMFEKEAPGSLDRNARFLARSIESFDVALLEALLPLQVGGTVVTAPRQEILVDLGKAMRVLDVTHAAVVPSLFFRAGKRVEPKDLPSLRALIVGGERVTSDIIQVWASSRVPLLNAYGPTEATIGTSVGRLYPESSTGSIGKAFAGTQYLILKAGRDNALVPALRGEAGELCIAGLQLGSYLGDDEKEAFTTFEGTRIYRTGDEGRMLADDSIQYLGRIGGDTQVKIRGVRIELGEIDGTLAKDAKRARNMVTRLVKHESWSEERIVTFIATDASTDTGESDLCISQDKSLLDEARSLYKAAKTRLPSRMVPSSIIPLESLPLAPLSGKVDGKVLSRWVSKCSSETLASFGSTDQTSSSKRDLNDVEKIIAAEVERLVKVEKPITPSTDLFSIGVDSLSFLSLAGALANKGISANVGVMMSNPTVEGIAEAASGQQSGHEGARASDADDWDSDALRKAAEEKLGRELQTAYPTLPLQAAMVAETINASDEKDGGALPYINVAEYVLPKHVDGSADALAAHVEDVLNSHDIYRAIFVALEKGTVQAIVERQTQYRFDVEEGDDWNARAQQEIARSLETTTPLRFSISVHESRAKLRLAIHHALYDGVSLSLLLEQIAETWGQKDKDEMLEGSYSFDEVVHAVAKDSEETRLEHWAEVLRDVTLSPFPRLTGKRAPDVAQLPKMREMQSTASLKDLKRKAKDQNVTVAMLALSHFARLYSQYVGEPDVTFGLVLNGRDAATSEIHGPCVNTVPFRVKMQERDSLKQIREDYASAQRFQHVPMTDLARRLGVQSSLFNTLFSYLSGSAKSERDFEELSGDMLTGFPLAIEVEPLEESDKLAMRIVYDPSHIPEAQALLFLQQYDAEMLERTMELPQEALSVENLDISDTGIQGFVDYFRARVAESPDEIAYVHATSFDKAPSSVTFKELDEQSERIARSLKSVEGSVIGVHLRQCREIYALLVGLWKAGKTYLPLDPSLPLDRLQYIVEVAQPAEVITIADHTESAKALKCSTQLFDDLVKVSDGEHELASVNLDKAAYIMFTSGSTGKPKGVQISHQALGAAILSWSKMLPHKPKKSRLLQLASPGFDVFLIEVCMPLALGFSFATAPKELLLDDLETTFHKLQLTMADLPAALASTVEPSRLPKLEWLMSGGDQIDQRTVEQWSSTGLVNAWGPTEATIGNTLGFVTPDSSRSWIGKPYPTSSIFVLDSETHQVLPRGCAGELCVGGPQVADGYVGNKELTEERFIEIDVPSTSTKERIYCTGDKGRLLTDGSVEILGRIEGDGQVKINSQRVELGEIELAISKHEDVSDAAVLYVQHPELPSKQLVAFVITSDASSNKLEKERIRPDQDAQKLGAAIAASIGESLPAYMVPQHMLVMNDKGLPLTPNDKKDKRALRSIFEGLSPKQLRELQPSSEGADEDDKKPWTPTEQRLRSLIAGFVETDEEELTRTMSLHRLGIDSISGFRLARMLKDNGFAQVTVRTLLRSPTIAKLAKSLEGKDDKQQSAPTFDLDKWRKQATTGFDASKMRLTKDDIVNLYPCTPLQQGLLIEGIASEGSLYVHHHAFDVKAADRHRVIRAFESAVQRHDILRTSFHLDEGDFIQAVHSNAPLTVEVTSCGEKDFTRRLSTSVHSRFFGTEKELARPPVKLLVFGGQDSCVIDLVIHHAMYDGETLSLLFHEIEASIENETSTETVQFGSILPSLIPTPETNDFWVKKLASRRDTIIEDKHEGDHAFVVNHPLSTRAKHLIEAATSNDVSIHVMALLAFVKVLAHEAKQRDVVFAQLFGLRDSAEGAENALGPALNTVLTPFSIRSEETVKDALVRLQRENDEARDFRAASLADVQRALSAKRGGQTLKFDALFDFQRSTDSAERQENVLKPHDLDDDANEGDSQYALNVEFIQQGDNLSVVSTFSSRKYSRDDATRLLKTLDKVLSQVIESGTGSATAMPDGFADLSELSLESSGEEAPSGNPTTNGAGRGASSPVEKQMADVVAEMTGIRSSDLDAEAELSRFGLDSIAAIRLASKLRKAGLQVGVVDILQGKTIAAIAQRAGDRSQANGSAKAPAVNGSATHVRLRERAGQTLGQDTESIESALPLLPGQAFELAAAAHDKKPDAGIFTFYCQLGSNRSINAEALEEAWSQLRRQNGTLRTTFASLTEGEDAGIHQVTLTASAIEGRSSLVRKEVDVSIQELISSPEKYPMQDMVPVDLSMREPPCAYGLISARDGEVVALRMHHALYDGYSIPILINELSSLYNGGSKDGSVHSSDRHVDFASHLTTQRASQAQEAEKYWSEESARIETSIISSTPSKLNEARSFLFFRDALPKVATLEKKATAVDGGLPAIIMAAWSALLSQYCKTSETVTFGTYQVGRTSAFDGIEELASNCMNIVPVIAARLEKEPSKKTLSRQASDIKKQLDARARIDETTSLIDVLRYAHKDTAPFNTYLNLLWGQADEPTQHGAEDAFEPITAAMTRDIVANAESAPMTNGVHKVAKSSWLSTLPNLNTDINIDVQRVPNDDAVHIGFQWRADIWTPEQVRGIVKDLCGLVQLACQ